MGILNFIAKLIIAFIIGSKSDESIARELHEGGFSNDEIGDLLDMSEDAVKEATGENDHDPSHYDSGYYGF